MLAAEPALLVTMVEVGHLLLLMVEVPADGAGVVVGMAGQILVVAVVARRVAVAVWEETVAAA